jgi:hypothetical protein
MSPRDSFVTESIESGDSSKHSVNSLSLLNNDDKDNEFLGKSIGACSLLTLVMPCVICDLFFALTDKSCVNENVGNINLKQYLLGTGIFTLLFVISNIICIFMIINKNIENEQLSISILYIVNIIGTLFTIIWNIIGAIIFWGSIYKENICSKDVSIYLFVVLIIRLLSIYGFIQQVNNNK